MTSVSAETYARQSLRDGLVLNLEVTLLLLILLPILFFNSGRQSDENHQLFNTQKCTKKAKNSFAV